MTNDQTQEQNATAATPVTTSIYDIHVNTIDGKDVTLSQYKGKKILIVNVASECGLTPQYAQLEELYKQHKDKLVILGFPANNFGGQEPGSNQEISTFCQKNYGVSFPMFSKISVKGDDEAPLYHWLTDKDKNGWNTDQPDWNFAKYLIDENGKLIAFFPAKTEPLSEEIVSKL